MLSAFVELSFEETYYTLSILQHYKNTQIRERANQRLLENQKVAAISISANIDYVQDENSEN